MLAEHARRLGRSSLRPAGCSRDRDSLLDHGSDSLGGTGAGGLQLQSPDPNAFGEADQTTLELLAGFAGAAISRARGAEAIRASEQLFSGTFQASGIGMALTSLDGRVTRANPALCQMLAYTEAELAGMDARTLVVPKDLDRVAEIIAAQQDINDTGVEIDRILGTLVVRAVHLTGASAAAVMLPNGGEMRIHAAAGAMKIPIGFSLSMSRSLAGLAYQTSRLQRVSNARVD